MGKIGKAESDMEQSTIFASGLRGHVASCSTMPEHIIRVLSAVTCLTLLV